MATELLVDLAGARWVGDATCTASYRRRRSSACGPSEPTR